MKKIIFFIIMVSMYAFLFAEEDAESADDTKETAAAILGGFHAGISAFDYFKISAGVQLGQFTFEGHHSFASVFGISAEYQLPDILSLRGFYRAYGSSGGLVGISVPVMNRIHTTIPPNLKN